MPKPISANNATPIRVVIVTLDSHLAGAIDRSRVTLARDFPGLSLELHTASEWAEDADALARCHAAIAEGDIVVATMLFLEDHINAVLPALQARRDSCDAMICAMSAAEVMKLTRMGNFSMAGEAKGALAMLKRLKGKSSTKGGGTAGAKQMAMLRRLPRLLKYIPGTAQDVRAYFLTLQYWLAASEENVTDMVRFLISRYADGERSALRDQVKAAAPAEYPETGVYHPRMKGRLSGDAADLPRLKNAKGRVGLLVLRSYVLAGDTRHYDGVIEALEARGLEVVPSFAAGLDCTPSVEQFFMPRGTAAVDAVVSLTGFSLVGGPAYNDAKAAEDLLARLDVPYLACHPAEFQTLEQWEESGRGLLPVEATIMVAIPELDGATGLQLFGGRSGEAMNQTAREMQSHPERAGALAAKVSKLVAMRRAEVAERKVAIVLFNFPPNAGAVGSAAYLSVFESLFRTLSAMKRAGYRVDVPESVEALKAAIVEGNAEAHGADANVMARIPADDHVRREPHLKQIEAEWGPAPGRAQSDGRSIFVLGARFGNVMVGLQPAFGYEGDPMRLLFEGGFAPTHAFSAFYRYVREDFGAHAAVHFGTHGALEFMPGKQVGLSDKCWPERLIGDLPNVYLYAANNPSEGTIAKRRAGATLISYLTPPVAQAGLYKGLTELKDGIGEWRRDADTTAEAKAELAAILQAQAAELDLCAAEPLWHDPEAEIETLQGKLLELEYTLIPHGLHIVGEAPSEEERVDMLMGLAQASHDAEPPRAAVEALVRGASPEEAARAAVPANGKGAPANAKAVKETREALRALLAGMAEPARLLAEDFETPAILRALEGRFIRPAPGGDILRTPQILPTGRNIHGFDPFKIPSGAALRDGARQAARLLDRHMADGNGLPESVALVLWGTDNLKTEGAPIAQALHLMGAKPRFDSYGRLAGADLIPLDELGRPRIDVMTTLSGIFRDLLPLQTRTLADAAYQAAAAEEPEEMNFIRKHALAHMAEHGCDLETAALRVFSNGDGAYGSNVNQLVGGGTWDDEDELADAYTSRKGFAYGRNGKPQKQTELLGSVLKNVDLAYQNLESVELGITTIDHYFDTLGGISRAVSKARGGKQAAVYIADETSGGEGKVRTLSEQVALETRTRTLNPRWYEGMLKHGYEGVRQIEAQVTNTMGWSATTGQVQPWVYQQMTQTFVLDDEMRNRIAELNPKASAKVVGRLIEAYERKYWEPDAATLEALRQASDDIEDRLEGITEGVAA